MNAPNLAGFLFFSSYFLYRLALQIHAVAASPHNISVAAWLNWFLIMGIFLFFAVIYFVRGKPLVKARGWQERVIPFFCAIIPALLFEIPKLGKLHEFVGNENLRSLFFQFIRPMQIDFFGFGHWPANFLLIAGHSITLFGFLTLGKAFSIMTEARFHVSRGLYRHIRHPVYLGESIAILGICLSVPTKFGVLLTFLWLGAQRYRAFLEEKKLSSIFPSYVEYKKITGAYFPKFS